MGDAMGRLLIIAVVLDVSVIVLAGYSWAETCQTQCFTRGRHTECRNVLLVISNACYC
jgi:hypothetical protein